VSRRGARLRVADIVAAMERIIQTLGDRTAEQLAADDLSYRAVLYDFIVIGEAARTIPEDLVTRTPQINWRGMREMRNVLTHAYFGVNPVRVHATIVNDLPPTLAQLRTLLEDPTLN